MPEEFKSILKEHLKSCLVDKNYEEAKKVIELMKCLEQECVPYYYPMPYYPQHPDPYWPYTYITTSGVYNASS